MRDASRLVREGLFDKVTFGQRPECTEGRGAGEGHPGHSERMWFLHLKTRGGRCDWDGVNWRKEWQEREQGQCRALQDVTRTWPFL